MWKRHRNVSHVMFVFQGNVDFSAAILYLYELSDIHIQKT